MDILICFAMDAEMSPFLSILESKEKEKSEPFTYYKGKIKNHTLYIARTRFGKVNAAVVTTHFINKLNIDAVLMSGVAGGMGDSVAPGDMVISSKAVHHDVGMLLDEGFNLWETACPVTGNNNNLYFLPSSHLFNCARSIDPSNIGLKRVLDDKIASIHEGVYATGECFLASEVRKKQIITQLAPSAVDMETAAIAQVCGAYNKPWLFIKSVSDLADSSAGENAFEQNLPHAAKNAALFLEAFLKELN